MKQSHRMVFFFLLLLVILLPVQAHEATDIFVDRTWATPCANTNNITSVFMTVDNSHMDHAIALTGASTPIGQEIHLVEHDGHCDESMVDRIVIGAGEQLDFLEAGYAIAIQTGEDREFGEPFSLTLTFSMLGDNLEAEGTTVDVVVGVPVLEGSPTASSILVNSAWARPTANEMGMDGGGEASHGDHGGHGDSSMTLGPSAVYMRLLNRGDTPDRLIAASSPVATITEVHQTIIENDVMRMGEIEELELPPSQWTVLEPGGYHIMLIDLTHDLVTGDAILLDLVFESGAEMTIAVPVYDAFMGLDGDHDEHSH